MVQDVINYQKRNDCSFLIITFFVRKIKTPNLNRCPSLILTLFSKFSCKNVNLLHLKILECIFIRAYNFDFF